MYHIPFLGNISSTDSNRMDNKADTLYKHRESVRAIVLNEHGFMAIQNLTNCGYFKLPGGGIEVGETNEVALYREIIEEVGCKSIILRPLGVIFETRRMMTHNLTQISYCYIARMEGEIGTPSLDARETEEGHETMWLPPSEALKLMNEARPQDLKGQHITKREIVFLTEYIDCDSKDVFDHVLV